MKIKLSSIILDIKGVCGDLAYFKSKGQSVIRTRVRTAPTPSIYQLANRDSYGKLYALRNSMLTRARHSWSTYALRTNLTWWQLFVQANLNGYKNDTALQWTAAADPDIPTPVDLTVSDIPGGQITVTWNPAGLPANLRVGWLAYRRTQVRITYNKEDAAILATAGSLSFAANTSYDYQVALYFWDIATSYTGSSIAGFT